jgi:hypothetical protein
MTLSYTDSYGPVVDTGSGVQPTARTNTEIEFHLPTETDTGSKNTVVQTVASHIPHRPAASPR